MNVTDVRVRNTFNKGRLKAVVSITLDGVFAIHDIKVIEGPDRLFIAMPSRKCEDGNYRDIAHPIGSASRAKLEAIILEAYRKHISNDYLCISHAGEE